MLYSVLAHVVSSDSPISNAPNCGISYVFGLLKYGNCCWFWSPPWLVVCVCSMDAMGVWFEVVLFCVILLSMYPGPPVMLGARGAVGLMVCCWKFCVCG